MASHLSVEGLAIPSSGRSGALDKFEKFLALTIAGVVIYLSATEDLTWVPFVLGGLVAALLISVRWPWGSLLGISLAAAMPRWFFRVNNFKVKPEYLVIAACGMVLLARMVAKKHKLQQLTRADYLLFVFILINFVSSAFASPDPPQTLRWALAQMIVIFPVFLIEQVVTDQKGLGIAMGIWLFAGLAEAVFGILCYGSYIFFGTQLGVTPFYNLNDIPGVHGSQWEPNIFGSYCATFAVMFLYYFLAAEKKKGRYLLGFLIVGVGVLLSLARQAWASTLMAGVAILFFNIRRKRVPWKALAPLGIVILVAFIGAITVMKDLPDRLASLSLSQVQDDPTVVERGQYIVLALDDIRAHPIFGLGTASFHLMYMANDESYQGVSQAWLGSFFVRIVHDTGIVGFFFLAWYGCNLGLRAWRVLGVRDPTTAAIGALFAAVIVMVIAYQLTDASTLAFTWVHLGLLGAAVRIAERQQGVLPRKRAAAAA